MSDNIKQLVNAFKWVIILFVIIFFQFFLMNQFIYADLEHFVGNYLSIYQNSKNMLQQSGIPMWGTNLFLGGNFLGLQNTYSIFSPFFLVSLLFPSRLLVDLFLPFLFIKTILAGGALYLYMRETKWFSPATISLAMVLYIFNGWYFSYLNQLPFIDLMIYIPFALYGIEHLLLRGYRRYLVIALTLLLTSHLSFSLLVLPFLFLYWWVRFDSLNKENRIDIQKQIRLMIFTFITSIGLNMVILLPIILAGNTLQIRLEGEGEIAGFLTALLRTFFPTFHESYKGQLQFFTTGSSALFQSSIIFLIFPQFIQLLPKPKRLLIVSSYLILLGVVIGTQTWQLVNTTGIVPFNINILSLLFILFNALMVAYTLSESNKLNRKLLKTTGMSYKILMTVIIIWSFIYEINFGNYTSYLSTFELIKRNFIAFSPYWIMYLFLLIFIEIYQHLLTLMADEYQTLRRKSVFVVIIVECLISAFLYLGTHRYKSVGLNETIVDQEYVGNRIGAISNYLQGADSDFHRVISGFQIHGNDSLRQNINGFSIENSFLINSDFYWMLNEEGRFDSSNQFLTTALGAKYYLTTDSIVTLPGYEFYDRIRGVAIYRNRYFATIGKQSEFYILESDFNELTAEQKQYVFLKAVILPDETDLIERLNLQALDMNNIPSVIGTIQYFEAAQIRQEKGISNINYYENQFTHSFNSEAPTLLVYSIPFESGWRATANGEPIEVVQVNKGFIGIEIPEKGRFDIVLEYQTPGLGIGLGISTAIFILVIGYFYKKHEEEKENQ